MDTSFHVLLKQAADMKTEYMKPDREKIGSYPPWLQNSLFVSNVD